MTSQEMHGAVPPPPGVTPNFVDPPSLRNYDYASKAICVFLTTSIVAMRMYTKVALVKKTAVEDYLCCLSWVGYIAQAGLSIRVDKYGSGVHMWDLTAEDVVNYFRVTYVSQIMYGPTILLAKLSILLMILRVFIPDRRSGTFISAHFLIWANCIFYSLTPFLVAFMCTPREKIWMPSTPGKCININLLILLSTVVNIVSDFSLFLLPMPSVWRLQMGIRRKLALCVVFGAGLICVASVLRLVVSIQGTRTKDVTYAWFWEFVTISIEIALGIVCSCLPSLPAFFRHISRKISASNPSSDALYGANESVHPPKYTNGSINARSRSKHHLTTNNPWDDLDDSKLLPRSSYLELHENKPYRTQKNNPGETATTKGGPATISEETVAASQQQQQPADLEQGGEGGGGGGGGEGRSHGILKTVTVDQYSQ